MPVNNNRPYLIKKHIDDAHGARVAKWTRLYQDASGKHQKLEIENTLIIPMYNEAGELRNVQAIFPAEIPELGRNKDFLPGGELTGLFWWIGTEKTDPILIAEGYATACTLYEQTQYRTYIAFSAGNLACVGRIVRKHLPAVKIIFAADNDAGTPGNPGLTKATEAAAAVDGYVVAPPIPGDFNDYLIFLSGGGNGQ